MHIDRQKLYLYLIDAMSNSVQSASGKKKAVKQKLQRFLPTFKYEGPASGAPKY